MNNYLLWPLYYHLNDHQQRLLRKDEEDKFVFQVKTKEYQYFLLHSWPELLQRSLLKNHSQFGKMVLTQPAGTIKQDQDGINSKQANGYIKEDHALGQI